MSGRHPHDWADAVVRHAQACGITLDEATVAELAMHLEDLYQAARERGADHGGALTEARDALAHSGIAQLQDEPRVDRRAGYARLAESTAAASRSGGLAIGHALRMALRLFRHHPAFALIVVLILGVGTGAATVVYTIVDAVVLRPLPYRAPERLVKLWDTNSEKGLRQDPVSPVTLLDYRALPVFHDAAAWWRPTVNLVDPGLEPVRVNAIETSGNLFALLGVSPQLGPGFAQDGPFFSGTLVAVISDRLWRTRYAGDPRVVGRLINLNAQAHTVVGVMPPGFHFPDDVDVWQRLSWDLAQHSRMAHFMEATARLADGVTLEEARAASDTLAVRLGREFAASNHGWAFALVPLLEDQLGYYRPALFVLFGAVALLFVIACLNVASLVLTRAVSRSREIAVRTALGATPRQIVTQLLAEGLALSLLGAVAGVAVALIAIPLVVAWTPVDLPRLADAAVNVRVLAVASGLVVAMTLVFGVVPSLVTGRRQRGGELRSGDRGSSRATRWAYNALVAGEVALACALLTGSALLIRTVGEMTRVSLGVDGDKVVLANIQLTVSSGGRDGWERVGAAHAAILDRIRDYPGVRSAGAANFLPAEHGWRHPLILPEHSGTPPSDLSQVQYHAVSEGYFETMGATLREGRFFTADDDADGEPVVIVNETLAKRYFAGRAPLGQEMVSSAYQIGPLGRNLTWQVNGKGQAVSARTRIVGVVADVHNAALGAATEPAIFTPTRQFPFASVTLAVAARDEATAVHAVRDTLRALSPETPIGLIETWRQRIDARTAEPRLLMTTLTAFGAIAAFLAALGVYGLFSWSVALRRRELAIRLTLGARPLMVGASVVRHSLWLIVCGVAAGLLLVQASRHALAAVLFGVTPSDASALAGAAGLLLLAALVATLPPAVRAMRVDPVEGLRAE